MVRFRCRRAGGCAGGRARGRNVGVQAIIEERFPVLDPETKTEPKQPPRNAERPHPVAGRRDRTQFGPRSLPDDAC